MSLGKTIYFTWVVFYLIVAIPIYSQVISPKLPVDIKAKLEILEQHLFKTESQLFPAPVSKSNKISSKVEKFFELYLKTKLSITNSGPEAVIIDKNSLIVAERFVTETGGDLKPGKLIFKETSYLIPTYIKLDMPVPESQSFLILKPNETYSTDLNDTLYPRNKGDLEHFTKGVFLKYTLLGWGGQTGLGEKTRERWRQFGYLWLDSIKTDYIPLKIEQNDINELSDK